MKSIISILLTSSLVFAATDTKTDWQTDLKCGSLGRPLKDTQLLFTDYTRGTREAMDACATYCLTEATSNGDNKYCCSFEDNTAEDRATYNKCYLELFTDGMMTEETTFTSYKFKVQTAAEDTAVITAAKVFSFVSIATLGATTDSDGTDEITRLELELHADGTDSVEQLLAQDGGDSSKMKADKSAQFEPNGFKFYPTNENCYITLNILEDDGASGTQKASTMLRCNEIDMDISKLQFRANTAGSEAMDEASLAITYSITDVDTFNADNRGVSYGGELKIDKGDVPEPDCDISDLCGVIIFGNGFFCNSA